jgi:hypothetical protein
MRAASLAALYLPEAVETGSTVMITGNLMSGIGAAGEVGEPTDVIALLRARQRRVSFHLLV